MRFKLQVKGFGLQGSSLSQAEYTVHDSLPTGTMSEVSRATAGRGRSTAMAQPGGMVYCKGL